MPRKVSDSCPHYSKGVPEGHKCDAKIILVGEAPGRYEDQAGIPFVGPAGHRLGEYLRSAGLKRSDLYVTNVVPYRPPANDITKVNPQLMERYVDELHARLSDRLVDPVLCVPTGNTAFSAVTGIKARHRGDALITKWRGSILQGRIGERQLKVIPTIHPAAALRESVLDKTERLDWARIAEQSQFAEVDVPKRTLRVQPNRAELQLFLNMLRNNPHVWLSFDIETDPSKGQILCISFAVFTHEGYSVTYYDHRDVIADILGLPNPKVGQNFLYDAYWLAQDGIEVANLAYDAGAMFHALDPNAGPQTASKDAEDPNAGRSHIKPYSLAYMASIFTEEPYYKEEGRDEEGRFMKVNGDATRLHQLQSYNAKDACVTLEVVDALHYQLLNAAKLEFYNEMYRGVFEANLYTMLHGSAIDVRASEELSAEYRGKMDTAKSTVAAIAGVPLEAVKEYKRRPKDWSSDNPKFLPEEQASKVFGTPWVRLTGKSLSSKKVQQYLYGVLKLPKRTKKGKDTADEAALQDLRLKYPDQGGPVIDAILEFRKFEKLSQYLKKGLVDADGRVRCQYKDLVQTGRCSSTKNPKGTGMNLQNVPPEVRHVFVPDEVDA